MSIPDAVALLSSLMRSDATLSLAAAVAWLDPIAIPGVDYDAEADPITYALDVCRECFEDIYLEAVPALWQGISNAQFENLILNGLSEHLVFADMMGIEDMVMGIPVFPIGVEYYGEDPSEEEYPRLIPVLKLLGWHPSLDIEAAQEVGLALANHLSTTYSGSSTHDDLAALLYWMFNSTGYVLADYSQYYWYQQGDARFDWTPDEIEHVNGLHKEAFDAHDAAMRGLHLIEDYPEWAKALKSNAAFMADYLIDESIDSLTKGNMRDAKKTNRTDTIGIYLDWPECVTDGYSGTS